MQQTHISFPQIRLSTRDGHKLRGYFARLFGEESDLFHNHDDTTKRDIYRYPLIQYKVVNKVPMLVGLDEGATLLIQHFLKIEQIEIEGLLFPVFQKDMKSEECLVGVRDVLHSYRFVNPWMALNQKNFKKYIGLNEADKKKKLETILIGNILTFFKAIDYFEKKKILISLNGIKEIPVNFKNEKMIGFTGEFTTNVALPDYIGLGKSVARGFGTIIKNKH